MNHLVRTALLLLLATVAAPATPARWTEEARVAPSAGQQEEAGVAVALDGRLLVLGAPAADPRGLRNAGAAYLFVRPVGEVDVWKEVGRLSPSALSEWDEFGSSVAVRGRTLAVGAPSNSYYGTNAGRVYLYRHLSGGPAGWVPGPVLRPGGGEEVESFGAAIALDGDTLAVGAPENDFADLGAGAVYVFRRDPADPARWIPEAFLVGSQAGFADDIGQAVALAGDTLAVGGWDAAYVFERDASGEWGEVAVLLPPDPTESRFGETVATDGEMVAVGARNTHAHVYHRHAGEGGWGLVARLTSSDQAVGTGRSVAIAGRSVVAGSGGLHAAVFAPRAGDPTDWIELPGIGTRHELSLAGGIAADGTRLVLGAAGASGPHPASGAAYVFRQRSFVAGIGGNCPGTAAVTAGGATPGGTVAFFWSAEEGISKLPSGPCAGTPLSLAEPRLVTRVAADGAGEVAVETPLYAATCRSPVQAVDEETCAVSNPTVALLEPWRERQRIDHHPEGRDLGTAVAVAGDTMVAGASAFSPESAAFAWRRGVGGEWKLESTLLPEGVAPTTYGYDLALDAGLVAIAGGKYSGPRYVWLFARTPEGEWREVRRLSDPHGHDDAEEFASSVALDGAILAVGGSDHPGVTVADGAVLLYERQGWRPDSWRHVATVAAPDGANDSRYAWSVALSGDTLVVGAPFRRRDEYKDGAAYVYERRDDGGWGPATLLLADEEEFSSYVGWDVAIDGDLLVAGAPDHTAAGIDSGAAFVFERDPTDPRRWLQVARLIGHDTNTGDALGTSVAIDGSTILVGAADGPAGFADRPGAVYAFERRLGSDGWGQAAKLVPADPEPLAGFGTTVALDGGTAAVGAPERGFEGTLYVFEEADRGWLRPPE